MGTIVNKDGTTTTYAKGCGPDWNEGSAFLKATAGHTPGPWRAEIHPRNDEIDVYGSDNYRVASFDPGEWIEEKPNAALIRHAPELVAFYGQVQLALKYLEHPDVEVMPFALPVTVVSKRLRSILTRLDGGA